MPRRTRKQLVELDGNEDRARLQLELQYRVLMRQLRLEWWLNRREGAAVVR